MNELAFYKISHGKFVDFKTSLDNFKDIKVLIDDLFEEFEKWKLDYMEIC